MKLEQLDNPEDIIENIKKDRIAKNKLIKIKKMI